MAADFPPVVKSFSTRADQSSAPSGGNWKLRSSVCFEMQPKQASRDESADRPHSIAQRAAVFGLLFYKVSISPLLPSCCKFYPTCSLYAKEAIERHGVTRGLGLALRRVLRCRPFAPGGHDPVPDA